MGLSGFNRMRRERNQVETIEAERFKIANEARNAARLARDAAREETDAMLPAAAEAEQAAREAIGEKNVAGLKTDDLPLRKDHAAEIAGRNVEEVQAPKDPVQARLDRVPEGTVNEQLVEHLSVDQPGPSPELVEAAAKEVGAIPNEDAPKAIEDLPLAEGGTADIPTETPQGDPAPETNEAGEMQKISDETASEPAQQPKADTEAEQVEADVPVAKRPGRKPKATDGE